MWVYFEWSQENKTARLHECGAPDPQTPVGQVDGCLLEPGHQHDDVVPPLPPFRPLSREWEDLLDVDMFAVLEPLERCNAGWEHQEPGLEHLQAGAEAVFAAVSGARTMCCISNVANFALQGEQSSKRTSNDVWEDGVCAHGWQIDGYSCSHADQGDQKECYHEGWHVTRFVFERCPGVVPSKTWSWEHWGCQGWCQPRDACFGRCRCWFGCWWVDLRWIDRKTQAKSVRCSDGFGICFDLILFPQNGTEESCILIICHTCTMQMFFLYPSILDI